MNIPAYVWAIATPAAGGLWLLVFQAVRFGPRLIGATAGAFLILTALSVAVLYRDFESATTPLTVTIAVAIAGAICCFSAGATTNPSTTARTYCLGMLATATLVIASLSDSVSTIVVSFAGGLLAASGCTPVPKSPDSRARVIPDFNLNLTAVVVLATGLVLLMIVAGSDDLSRIQRTLQASYRPGRTELSVGRGSLLGVVSLVLILVGCGVPFAVFPLQAPAAIRFETTPGWLSGWLAIVTRGLALVVLFRIPVGIMVGFEESAQLVLLLTAIGTTLAGTCLVCRATALRNLAAALWLVQAGPLLLSLAAQAVSSHWSFDDFVWPVPAAPVATIIGFTSSSAMLLIVVLLEDTLRRPERRQDFIEDLTGLAAQRPVTAGALVVAFLSACAIPPTPAFWHLVITAAKSLQIGTASRDTPDPLPAGLVVVAFGVVTVSLVIVLSRLARLVSVMYFDQPLRRQAVSGTRAPIVCAGLMAVTLVICGLMPAPLLRWLGELLAH